MELFVIYTKLSSTGDISFSKFLKKVKFGYIFTNIALFVIFYFLLNHLYIPFNKHNGFKLSGHILAAVFSGAMITNVQNLAHGLKTQNLKKRLMDGIILFCKFMLFHNLYTCVWTVWVFHLVREVIISLLVSTCYALIINYVDVDRLFWILLTKSKINHKKEKNSIIN